MRVTKKLSEVERYLGRVILALVTYRDRESVRTYAANNIGVPMDLLDATLDAAEKRIAIVADYDRQHELAIQVERLNRLYEAASNVEDITTGQERTSRLSEQRKIISDLAKLLELQKFPAVETLGESAAIETERLTRDHLEALSLCENNLPIEELARRVALAVTNLDGYTHEPTKCVETKLPTKKGTKSTNKPRTVARRQGHSAPSASTKSAKKSGRKI